MAQPPKSRPGHANDGMAARDARKAERERAAHAQFKLDYAGHSRSMQSLFALASRLLPSLDETADGAGYPRR